MQITIVTFTIEGLPSYDIPPRTYRGHLSHDQMWTLIKEYQGDYEEAHLEADYWDENDEIRTTTNPSPDITPICWVATYKNVAGDDEPADLMAYFYHTELEEMPDEIPYTNKGIDINMSNDQLSA